MGGNNTNNGSLFEMTLTCQNIKILQSEIKMGLRLLSASLLVFIRTENEMENLRPLQFCIAPTQRKNII